MPIIRTWSISVELDIREVSMKHFILSCINKKNIVIAWNSHKYLRISLNYNLGVHAKVNHTRES